MSDLKAIQDAIEAGNRAFEEFKKVNDQRLEKVEKGTGGAGELKAQMEKIFAEMESQKKILEEVEAKAKRPGVNSGKSEADEANELHRKGFDGFMRKGNENGLTDLEAKAYGIGSNGGADGGYAVPKVIDNMIDDLVVNISPIRALANVVQISTPDYHKLINKRGTQSGWVGETDARGATGTSQLADIKPTMGELYANPQATQQMLDDVFFNAEAWLAEEVATEFARAEGAAFILGDGVNKPTGFLSAPNAATADGARAFGTVEFLGTGVAGGFAASNPADLLFNVVAAMKAGYRAGSSWVMNKATKFEVAQFKDQYGRYIFNPSTAPGVPDSLLGYALVEAEDMPAIAANSLSIAFGNFKRAYLIVDRIGTRVLRDPFTNKPYIGFYTTKRVGGQVTNSEALKLVKFA